MWGSGREAAIRRNRTCLGRTFQDASEEAGFPLLGLALALCGSNHLSRLVRRPKRRRKLPVPPLLGNRRNHPEDDAVLPGAVTNTFGTFYCALSQLPSCYPHVCRITGPSGCPE